MTYEGLALLLMVVGFALIVAEVFIPSGGMILVLCIAAFVASIWCAYKAWWVGSTHYFYVYLASLGVLIPGAVVGLFRALERTSLGNQVMLPAPSADELTPHQAEVDRLTSYIGKRGVALNLMTPGGMVRVAGERVHASTEGLVIQPGTPVEVIAVKGTRVIVRTASTQSVPPTATPPIDPWIAEEESTTDPPLDFEIPQS